MKIAYDLFLTDANSITEVISEDSNTLRLDNVEEDDVLSSCEMSTKYGFTVAAFLCAKD